MAACYRVATPRKEVREYGTKHCISYPANPLPSSLRHHAGPGRYFGVKANPSAETHAKGMLTVTPETDTFSPL